MAERYKYKGSKQFYPIKSAQLKERIQVFKIGLACVSKQHSLVSHYYDI